MCNIKLELIIIFCIPISDPKNMALTTNLEALSLANHDFSFSLYKVKNQLHLL